MFTNTITAIPAQTASATSVGIYLDKEGSYIAAGLAGIETVIVERGNGSSWAAYTATASATIQHALLPAGYYYRAKKSQTTASVSVILATKDVRDI